MSMRVSSRFPTTGLPDCGPNTSCDPAPACPACGGLQCLCRPRFFAGQLLTEDDLNRLDDYIVAKNRLHNRHLVGWGVSCGLEVVCSPCDPGKSRGRVLVRPGYALSPCGNDIIVCQDQPVDICALIARCRPADDMCVSPDDQQDDCGDGTDDWILGICYAEKPSRGVTALLNASDPARSSCGCKSSGCGCGKSGITSKSGCGCGGHGKAAGGARSTAARPAPQCEPTLMCESYSFAVWKAPTRQRATRTWGEAAQRFLCCVEPFLITVGQFPQDVEGAALVQWYLDLRASIRDFLVGQTFADCELTAKVTAAAPPANADLAGMTRAGIDLVVRAAAVIQKCLCAAVLPPCPDTASDDCVPIATVTVKRRPCAVVSICNVTARKFLVTMPNLQYWLSFFVPPGADNPLTAALRDLCCAEPALDGNRDALGFAFQHAGMVPPPVAQDAGSGGPFFRLLSQALAQPDRPVNAATFLLGAMGLNDPQGRPLVSDFELANAPDFLLLRQVVAPVLRTLAPFDLAGAVRGRAAEDPRVAALAQEVADLKRTVAKLGKR
jgi:hypothetical protein